MTGQDLLDTMELLNQELQLQSGEADVSRGLLALNVAQDFFEAAAAKRVNVFGSSDGTVTQTQDQEYTTYPTGLLRLDGLQYVDPATSRPAWDLTPRFKAGSHVGNANWLVNLGSSTSTGKPRAFWTNGSKIFWDPLPDTANTVRWYGFQAASDITASGTFAYPDIVRLPLASFAVSILKIGVDDDPSALTGLSENLFGSILEELDNANRSGARPLVYTYSHQ